MVVPGFATWNGKVGGSQSAEHVQRRLPAFQSVLIPAAPPGPARLSRPTGALRFFGTTNDNTVIFNGSGSLNPPGTSGMWPGVGSPTLATYNAILTWLTATTDPFPMQMRSGRVKYYGSIPAAITGTWPTYGNTDQQFWAQHPLYARLPANVGGQLHGHQRHVRLRQRFHLGNHAALSCLELPAPQNMNYNDNPCDRCCAAGSGL